MLCGLILVDILFTAVQEGDSTSKQTRDHGKWAKSQKLLADDEVPEEVRKAWANMKGRDNQTKFINAVVVRKGDRDLALNTQSKFVQD